MTRYSYNISLREFQPSFIKLIQVGNRVLKFNFQWAIVSEEQFGIIDKYLITKSNSDPLIKDGSFDRTYNWFEYYYALRDVDIDDWLDGDPVLPVSINGKPRATQKYLLNLHIQEAVALAPAMRIYDDILKWQFTMTSDDLDTVVGYVQPGGWYHNQDNNMSFRFTSEIDRVGKDDITKVAIVFEVYDE